MIIIKPGSEIQGVPESETKHTLIPAFNMASISNTLSYSVNLLALINNPLLLINLDS